MITRLKATSIIGLVFLLVAGCQETATFSPEITPNPTRTDLPPPSETAIPLAAVVNGETITLEDFENELARFHDARGTDLATENSSSEIVLEALIERLLLAQGARSRGISFEESDLDSKIEALMGEMGGTEYYTRWLQENRYTEGTFRDTYAMEILASEMIEVLISEVPKSEIQAHARHILVLTQEEAENIRQQLSSGADFGELAALYSMDLSTKPGGGDLGWFPTGSLTAPEVENAIFDAVPGEESFVVVSEFGYHVIQLIALEERPLPYEALLARQEQAVENWLENQLSQADIEVFIEI